MPRYMASPDINTEDFQAAVDFLSVMDEVDRDKIGIFRNLRMGRYGAEYSQLRYQNQSNCRDDDVWYGKLNANGYFDEGDREETRYQLKRRWMNKESWIIETVPMPVQAAVWNCRLPMTHRFFVKDYSAYYKGRAYA